MDENVLAKLKNALAQQIFPNEEVFFMTNMSGCFIPGLEERPTGFQLGASACDMCIVVTSNRILVAKRNAFDNIGVETIPWNVVSGAQHEENMLGAAFTIDEHSGRSNFFSVGWNYKSELRSLHRTIQGILNQLAARNQPSMASARQAEIDNLAIYISQKYSIEARHVDATEYSKFIVRDLASKGMFTEDEMNYFIRKLTAAMARFI